MEWEVPTNIPLESVLIVHCRIVNKIFRRNLSLFSPNSLKVLFVEYGFNIWDGFVEKLKMANIQWIMMELFAWFATIEWIWRRQSENNGKEWDLAIEEELFGKWKFKWTRIWRTTAADFTSPSNHRFDYSPVFLVFIRGGGEFDYRLSWCWWCWGWLRLRVAQIGWCGRWKGLEEHGGEENWDYHFVVFWMFCASCGSSFCPFT